MRTSETNPILIDFLPIDGIAGRLGLTFAPGKKDHAGNWDRHLETDVHRLRGEYATGLLVSLIEEDELKHLRIERLYDVARVAGLRVVRFPIRDVDVPGSMQAAMDLVALILDEVRSGESVVVHCRGGLGRAGTIGSCCLVALGRDPDAAIASVRAARTGAVETRGQERFVHAFAKAWIADRG